jgi:hypothetical protein
MFEITFRGRTVQFETAKEMEEWRQRMMPRDFSKPKKRKHHVKKTEGLSNHLKRRKTP